MMTSELFTWSDDYSVGIQAIDEQHRTLIGLINQLHLAIVEHHGKATACEVLDRVTEYTRNHFMLEERLMQLSNYPDYEAHRQQHAAMIDQVQTLRHRFYDESQPIAFDLLYLLKKWLIGHIVEGDKHFGAYFVQTRRNQEDLARNSEEAPLRKKWWAR